MKNLSHHFLTGGASRALSAFVLILFVAVYTHAAPFAESQLIPTNGSLDLSFTASVLDGESASYTSEVLPDGRVLSGGAFQLANGVRRPFLVMLTGADGSIDTSFNTGGAGPNGVVFDIMRLGDGKFLIGGSFTSYNGVAKTGLVRINPDGTLDTTFNQGGSGAANIVNGISVQPDGKIIISGSFISYNGVSRLAVARLNADGTLDTSFASPFASGGPYVESTNLQPDGKIIIAGNFNLFGKFNIGRLNSDGSPDSTFNAGGFGANSGAYAIATQADGKILIGGAFTNYNGATAFKLARLNPDGSLDGSFNVPFFLGNGTEFIEVLPDGKILIAGGYFDGTDGVAIARLNPDGSADETFAQVLTDAAGYHIARQADGKLILTGLFNKINDVPRRNIVRLNGNGSVDATFGAALSTFAQVFDVAPAAGGKTIVAGNFRLAGGAIRPRLARFNPDGTLDPTFDTGTSTSPDLVSAFNLINTVAVQPDGKILIGGAFGGYNGTLRRGVARLNPDGTLDETFSAGLEDPFFFQNVRFEHILPLADGKIMVAGQLLQGTSSVTSFVLIRLNSDGSRDLSFTDGSGNGFGQRVVAQPDGKFVLVGNFTFYNNTAKNRIVRVNPDSSIDQQFSIGTGPNASVLNVALQPDGKLLIGGQFTTYNGTPRSRMARLNSDGTLDVGFNVGSGADANVTSFALQPDQKVIAGGFFTTYNGTPSPRLVRLNPDGTRDASFISGFDLATAFSVRRMFLQPDNKLVIGGVFDAYAGIARNNLVRLATANPVAGFRAPFDYDGDDKTDLSIFRPSVGQWWLNRSSTGTTPAYVFGSSTDRLVPADYTGDQKTDVAFWRPSTGEWYILRSEDTTFYAAPFGANGDRPIPGDYDADGKADLAVHRASTNTWYILKSAGGTDILPFGAAGDTPVVGDYDGDSKTDIAIYRTALGQWWIRRSSDGNTIVVNFGNSSDKPVQGYYTADNKMDVAFWRPSTGEWYIVRSEDNSFYAFPFGANGDIPVPGDYDGDDRFDAGVFRPSSNTWFVNRTTAGTLIQAFGSNGDVPTPSVYVP
jgi:uncharacterized delta-60 repeat protein